MITQACVPRTSKKKLLRMTDWSQERLLELNLDAFLTLYKENEFPLELGKHLSLDQCESLIPDGPGGWRKVSAVLMCLVRKVASGIFIIINSKI